MPEALIAEQLAASHGVERSAAAQAAALAGGSIGRALALAGSDELPKRMARVEKLLAAARANKMQEMLDAAAELTGERDEAIATLEMLWVAYHDALVLASGHEAGGAGKAEAKRLATRVPTAALLRGVEAVEEAQGAVRGYVAPQLAFERLLLRISQARAA
jgi:DNA polymerase-3 subunit delta'